MTDIQFCATSIISPELADRSLKSLSENLIGNPFKESTLYINVDNNPVDDRLLSHLHVCFKYFKDVVLNPTNANSFPRAVRWCWSNINPNIPYTMHLELDWEMIEPIEFKRLIPTGDTHSITIRAFNNTPKFYLLPTVHRTSFLKELVDKMNPDVNPEVAARVETVKDTGFELYPPHIVIRDIGRPYFKENGLARNSKNPLNFTQIVKASNLELFNRHFVGR